MASPAAVLSILVEANTSAANAGLAKTNAELDATKANALGATSATSRTSSAMRKLGTAAKWGGAALAVGFVVEAKKAVTSTQDLTKTTLTLHKNLGLGVKVSSEWGAALKARGADATKAGMAFKTFATQLSGANDGSATSIAMFKKLGLSQDDIQKAMTNTEFGLKQVADGLNALPAGADKASISGKLFGRGWQTVAPILRDGSAAMQETLDTQEKYGAFLEGKGFQQQKTLLQNIKDNRSAWLGLQVQLAGFVTPALNDVSDQFQRIAEIMADPKLTQDERFTKVADIIQKDFSTALNVIVKMIPTIASRVGEQAPKIAEGLVNGFLQADIWGKLLLGSWLLGKLGGSTGIIAGGKKAGLLLGRAFAASALGSMVIEKLGLDALFGANAEGRLSTTGARAGTILGRAFGLAFITLGVFELTRWSQDKLGPLLKIPDNVFKSAHQDFGALADLMAKSLHPIIDSARKDWGALKDVFHKGTGAVTGIFHGFAAGLRELMAGIRNAFRGVMSVVRTVVHFIVSAVNRAVSALGSLKDKIPDITPSLPDLPSIPSIPTPSIPFLGQRGGPINAGAPSGDSVPALLERGEYVLNRHATAKVGKETLDKINFNKAPRFAGGGVIEQALGPYTIPPIMYDPNHAGGNSHVHADFFTVPQALTYGHKMQGMGWSIGEYTPSPGNPFHFGPITTSHQSPGHYDGTAFDANTAANETRSQVAAVARLFNSGVAGAAGAAGAALAQIPNIAKHIEGRGPLAGVARGAANKLRKLGDAYLGKLQPRMTTTGQDFPTGAGVLSRGEMRGLLKAHGLPDIFGWIAEAESALNPNAIGHDPGGTTGYGLWQITSGFNDALINRFSPILDPNNNASAAAVLSSGGQNTVPWNASSPNWSSHVGQAYRKGGMVPFAGMFGQGGVVPGPMGAPRMIVAHGGETVGSGSPVLEQHTHVHLDGSMGALFDLIDGRIDVALEEHDAHQDNMGNFS